MGSCQAESRPLALRAPRDGIADVEAEDGLGDAHFTLWRGAGGLLVLDQELDHAVEGPQRHLRTARHPAQQGVLGNVQLVGQRLIALVHCGGLRQRPREDGVGHHACRELLLGMLTPVILWAVWPPLPGKSVRWLTKVLRLQETFGLLAHDVVALAGAGLEPLAVDDRQPAARIRDQTRLLQHAGGHRDARPAHAEHLGHELLREDHVVFTDPVVRHQEPAAQPFIDLVGAVAKHRLRDLVGERLREALGKRSQPAVTLDLALQVVARHAQALAGNLNHRFDVAGPRAEHDLGAEHALVADPADLDSLATLARDHQRHHAPQPEIDLLDLLAGFVKHRSVLQANPVAAVDDTLSLRCGQQRQQPVLAADVYRVHVASPQAKGGTRGMLTAASPGSMGPPPGERNVCTPAYAGNMESVWFEADGRGHDSLAGAESEIRGARREASPLRRVLRARHRG